MSRASTLAKAIGADGAIAVSGNTTLGDASTDTVTFNAATASIPNGINFTNGNFGLGATPSAWWSSGKAYQVGSRTSLSDLTGDSHLSNNAFFDGSNWKYITSNTAGNYYQSAGTHVWRYAGSGTSGANVSWTQAMTLTSGGNLGLGTTNPNVAGGTRAITLDAPIAGNYSGFELMTGGTLRAKFIGNSSQTYFGTDTATPLVFVTENTERARINSNGVVAISSNLNANRVISNNFVAGNIAPNVSGSQTWFLLAENENGSGGYMMMGSIMAGSYTAWSMVNLWVQKVYATESVNGAITGLTKNSEFTIAIQRISYGGTKYIALYISGSNPEVDVMWTGYRLNSACVNNAFVAVTSGVTVVSTVASY
jgi:hypothetical protein